MTPVWQMLAGWVGQRKQIIDEDLLEIARKNGTARVILTASGFDAFSVRRHEMSKSASQAQDRAIRIVFDQLAAQAGDGMKNIQLSYGTMAADMTGAAISRLIESKDLRIFSMQYNRGLAVPQLDQTTPYINMPAAWNAGYRGADQTIVIYDTGVLKTHDMMQRRPGSNAGVGSKVVSEDCFGSNADGYVSICPSQNAYGDSPPNTLGSAGPASDSRCPRNIPNGLCVHDTHVAAIAAGSPLPAKPALSGVAPDANIAAVQIYSWNGSTPTAFDLDIQHSLEALLTRRNGSSAFVAQISSGTRQSYTRTECRSTPAVSLAISQLAAAGIPVVIAAGNNNSNGLLNNGPQGLSWPTCLPDAIAVANLELVNAQGSVVRLFQNSNILPDVAGNPVFLAPGAGPKPQQGVPGYRGVESAINAGNGNVYPLPGTSFAAPHLSGLLAAFKAATPTASLANTVAWLRTTGSRPFVLALPNGVSQTYRSIRVSL